MTAPVEPDPVVIDALDVQGNVLAGFRKDHTLLIFFTIRDAAAFRRSMTAIVRRISSHEEVAAFNRAFGVAAKRLRAEPPMETAWLNLAFTLGGLATLGFDAYGVRDVAFRQGLAQRSPQLGDPWRPGIPGSPDTWIIGGTKTPCDGVFVVAADAPAQLDALRGSVVSELHGADVVLEFRGATLPPPLRGHEHFGFKDGVSQPLVRGVDDAHQNAAILPLIWPGEFVFGYPTQNGDSDAPGPRSGTELPWLRNGSFLVVRLLRQNVALFQQAMSERAAAGEDALTVAARGVGRWPSGAPLMRTPDADDPALAQDLRAENAFLFESPVANDRFGPVAPDPTGKRCPLNAHIRKAWPRDSQLEGETTPRTALRVHRIIRRGTPYGPVSPSTFAAPVDDGVDRGLIFMAYQTSISGQFEFITRAWLNEAEFPNSGTGIDPVFGCGEASSPPWITPFGGGYFFSPSLSFIRALVPL
jgi:Dyp-type peroxidase family